jgi:ABC-type branched-subunit amino acid transport system ATPase component
LMEAPLRIAGIRKAFDGTIALGGVSVSFPLNEITAIIGPNGAGKTTLLNVVSGFLDPDDGQVKLGDIELTHLAPHMIVRRGIVRTFQDLRLIELIGVIENVMLARQGVAGEDLARALSRLGVKDAERANRERATDLLQLVGLSAKANDLAGTLSYGQQKLLTLAVCLATDAKILFLDEPVSGIDPQMAKKILSLLVRLRDEGRTIIFIEHDLAAVRETAERVIAMDEGRVVAEGPPAEVFEMPEILEAYVG